MKKIFVYFFAICYFLSSCEKEVTEENLQISPEESEFQLKKGKRNLSDDEKKFRKKLEKTAFKLVSIANDKEAIESIQRGINRNVEYLQDEEIRFIDIFSESNGVTLKKQATQSYTSLSNKLKQIFEDRSSLKSGSDSCKNLDKWLTKNDIIIYWPYMDNWDGEKMITITFDPIDNDDVNYGFLKVSTSKKDEIDTVIVNEEYAINNPVWIIRKAEVPYEKLDQKSKRITLKRLDPGDPIPDPIPDPDPDPVPPTGREINRILLGHIQFGRQYDGFFDGGPEFKFFFIRGNINIDKTDGQSDYGLQAANLRRGDKWEWVRYYTELDDDWSVNESDRGFGLSEIDNGGTKYTFGFAPSIEIEILDQKITKALPSIEIEHTTEEIGGWLMTASFDREIFFYNNKKNMGAGLYDGFRVFKADKVKFTLPHQTYYIP